MSPITGFPALSQSDAQLLILGSMPSVASLKAQQYYGHPRNAFWPIMGRLYGFSPQLPYKQRVERLTSQGVAVWDVLHSCVRDGSLDSAIEHESIIVNDFSQFLAKHSMITHIFFNGAKADTEYQRRLMRQIEGERKINYRRLPSTSPANAGMTLEDKLVAWGVLLSP